MASKVVQKWARMWKNPVTLDVQKATEGGMGRQTAIFLLAGAGIPTRPGYSPYIGHIGIQVPARFRKRAIRALWGSR